MRKVRFLLDSCIATDLFNGLPSVMPLKEKLERACVDVSVMTRAEMLSFPLITPLMEREIHRFLKTVRVIPFTKKVEQAAVLIRRSKKLRLPDAIIAATALSVDATVISRDSHLLGLNWSSLPVISSV